MLNASMVGSRPLLPRRLLTAPLDMLLSIEPQNMQAQSLRKLIDNAVTREGYIGEHDGL